MNPFDPVPIKAEGVALTEAELEAMMLDVVAQPDPILLNKRIEVRFHGITSIYMWKDMTEEDLKIEIATQLGDYMEEKRFGVPHEENIFRNVIDNLEIIREGEETTEIPSY